MILNTTTLLRVCKDNTADVVNYQTIEVGDTFTLNPTSSPVKIGEVTEILEQREAQGDFNGKPWMWANVNFNRIN